MTARTFGPLERSVQAARKTGFSCDGRALRMGIFLFISFFFFPNRTASAFVHFYSFVCTQTKKNLHSDAKTGAGQRKGGCTPTIGVVQSPKVSAVRKAVDFHTRMGKVSE